MFFTGCWDSTETEKLGVISLMGIGLDKTNNIKVIVQERTEEKTATELSNVSNAPPFYLHVESGKTISEALEKMSAELHKRIYLAHTKIIVLDEKLVTSKGLRYIADFYERNPEIRLTTWVLISPRGKLDDLLSTDFGLNIDPGTMFEETIRNINHRSLILMDNLCDSIELLNKAGSELNIPGITVNYEKSMMNSISSVKPNNKFIIKDTAVFKGDKMVGWLENEEARGLAWVKGKINGGAMTLPLEDKELSLRIVRLNSKLKPIINDGKMKMIINIDIRSDIAESQADFNFMNDAVIKKVELAQKEKIKKEITAAIEKSRSLNSDVFGFGSSFNENYPREWRKVRDNWYNYYPNIEININLKTTIRNIGLIYKPSMK